MDPTIKKKVLRSFQYGLYIVTVRDGDAVNAFTANWRMQTSGEPPMLAFALENDVRSLGMVQRAGSFAMHVVPEDGREFAGRLGRSSARDTDTLATAEHVPGPATGSPIVAAHDGGGGVPVRGVACKAGSPSPSALGCSILRPKEEEHGYGG